MGEGEREGGRAGFKEIERVEYSRVVVSSSSSSRNRPCRHTGSSGVKRSVGGAVIVWQPGCTMLISTLLDVVKFVSSGPSLLKQVARACDRERETDRRGRCRERRDNKGAFKHARQKE